MTNLNLCGMGRSGWMSELVMMAPELMRGLCGFFSSFNENALKATPLGSCPTYS